MSRSRCRIPISGITSAESEKQDKRSYNRRYRRVTKAAVEAIKGDLDEMQHPITRHVRQIVM